ncbi:FCD domain-containing protein [Paracoccus fistulariae]|nr:FCD domain-containing protein [Paracoccus fistulariae]MDB6180033.1 FCD domain-containing protein [Paracoccus fistulariae]
MNKPNTIEADKPVEASSPGGGQARTLTEEAYDVLRKDIIDGVLEPGLKLQSAMLKERYGFGGSTLREALTRLSAQSLVTFEGQRGFRVAPMSTKDFADICDVRKIVETEALKRSILAGDEEWEARVVAAYHRLSRVESQFPDTYGKLYGEWEQRNHDFHAALLSACDSPWLLRMQELLLQQAERYRRITYATGSTIPRDVSEEHRLIMDAAIARDIDAACGLTASHIQKTLGILKQTGAFLGKGED